MMNDQTDPTLDPLVIEMLAGATPPAALTTETAARLRERVFERVHASSEDFLFVHCHEGEWSRLLQGVEFKLLRQDDRNRSFLLRLAPGARLPPHGHPVDEESLVLEGDVTINGVLCHAGDYHFAAKGRPHGWLTSDGGCLLFVRGATGKAVHP